MSVEADTMHYYADLDAAEAREERVERMVEDDDIFWESFIEAHAREVVKAIDSACEGCKPDDVVLAIKKLRAVLYAEAYVQVEWEDRNV